jgi:O-antigen/teichoic acid export membrane protein
MVTETKDAASAAAPLGEKGEGAKADSDGASRYEHHLRTDHLLGNLRGRAISGGLVTAAAQAGRFALNLASAVILARLLTPADFGLVAMVATVTGFLRIFKDAGLSTATVQKADITHAQVSNLFWVNVGLSAIMSLVVAAIAPAIAWFYREPRLVNVTLALAITFAASGIVVQPQALLNRQMRYKALAAIDVGSAAFGLLLGIVLARMGYGYWSLVAMQLSTTLTELMLTLWFSRWCPQKPRLRSGTRPMLRLGASLTIADFFRRLTGGCDTLLIGRFYGAGPVGIYSRGVVLLMRPLEQLISPFEAVFVPVLSRLQDQNERYRRTFLQACNGIALLTFPFAALCLGLSPQLVLVLLGPRWVEVTPVFAGFTIATIYLPLYYASMSLLTTQGRGKDIMAMGLIFSVTAVLSVLLGLPFGPVGVALAFSCTGLCVRLPIQFYIAGRHGPVRTRDLWGVALKYLPTWGAVLVATHLTSRCVSSVGPFAQLCISAPAGLLAGAAAIFAVPSQRHEVLRLGDAIGRFLSEAWSACEPLAGKSHS